MHQFYEILKQSSTPKIVIGEIDYDRIKKAIGLSKEDVVILDSSVIKIQDIRNLIHFLSLKPYQGKMKAAIINHIEVMTPEAANALLKTLEEPPPYARIILTSLNEARILPTILSRCQKFRFYQELIFTEIDGYLDPEKLGRMSLAERFKWVNEINEDDWPAILIQWADYFRQKMLGENKVPPVLKQINQARDLLQTNISVKLLIENIIISF